MSTAETEPPPDKPVIVETDAQPPGPPRRRWPFVLVAAFVIVFIFGRSIAVLYTDLLWYKEVGYGSVFWRQVGAQAYLVAIFGVVVFAAVFVNMLIAHRARAVYPATAARRTSPQEEILFRYREHASPHFKKAALVVAGLIGLVLGFAARGIYKEWLLFSNSVPFGIDDAVFGVDNSFYVFKLGFLRAVIDRLFGLMILTLFVTLVVYFLEGGIRFAAPVGKRVSSAVKVHLSVLFAVLALIQAASYWLQRYELVFSSRGVVTGASATDIKATLPALNLLVAISLVVAILLVANIWRRGWALPVVALGMWFVVQLIGVGIFPALYQRFAVQPQEFAKESEYISRNIEGTRQAYAIDRAELKSFSPTQSLTYPDAVAGDVGSSTRLWDPAIANDAYAQVQALRGYYVFPDSDIDRYRIGDRNVLSVVAARELARDRLPAQTWVTRHLQYTHGFGLVISDATVAAPGGRPGFVMSDIPPRVPPELTSSALTLTRPQIYFGESGTSTSTQDFVVVKTTEREFDFPRGGEGEATTEYSGAGGVPLTGFIAKAAFATRFGDPNLVLSTQITEESRLMFRMDIKDRVKTSMPFLELDSDPYPAIVDGKVLWIQDAYTVSSRYPYSQTLDAVRIDRGTERITDYLDEKSDLKHLSNANYVRNSVKATIDAYDGSVKLYVVDETDPVIKSYEKIFPDTFTPLSEASPSLRAHFRYAEDFFRVQSSMYRVYHVTDERTFYNQEDKWQVPERSQRVGTSGAVRKEVLAPYYTMLRQPGESQDSFVLVQPFTPQGKPNLLGFLVGNSDPDRFGQMTAWSFPKDRLLDGPETVTAKFNTDPEIAPELTLLDQRGSRVRYSSLLTLPVAGDLIYVQPVFVNAEDVNLPTVQRVIVAHKTRVVMRECTAAALADVLADPPNPTKTPCPQGAATPFDDAGAGGAPQRPPSSSTQPGGQPSGVDSQPGSDAYQQALLNAQRAYDEAQAALRAGNLALYQQKVDEMKRWIDEARKVQAGG
ncbi:MAG: hypothetical protein DCC49_12285 [Acidobacteria bacterium]|nr:MAG: hypothetical protein DCC49_12285 [Acidobacteriota bacterium]